MLTGFLIRQQMASLRFREQILLRHNTGKEVLITLQLSATSKRVANGSLLGDPLLAQKMEGKRKEGRDEWKEMHNLSIGSLLYFIF